SPPSEWGRGEKKATPLGALLRRYTRRRHDSDREAKIEGLPAAPQTLPMLPALAVGHGATGADSGEPLARTARWRLGCSLARFGDERMANRLFGAVCLLLVAGIPAGAVAAAEPAVVLIADGAGDYRGLSTAVTKAVAEAELPFAIEPACWSHGYRRSLADQL